MKIKSTVKPQLSQGEKCIIVPLCQSNNFPLDLELKIKHWTSVQTEAVSRINHENIDKKNLISSKHACDDSYYIFFSVSRIQIALCVQCTPYSNILNNSCSRLDKYDILYYINQILIWIYCAMCILILTGGTQLEQTLKLSASAFSVSVKICHTIANIQFDLECPTSNVDYYELQVELKRCVFFPILQHKTSRACELYIAVYTERFS